MPVMERGRRQENGGVVSPHTKIRMVPLSGQKTHNTGKGDWRETHPSFGETLQNFCALR